MKLSRPILAYLAEGVNDGFLIYHPEGEVRITECPRCGGSLAGLAKHARPEVVDGKVGRREMLICPSCRHDVRPSLLRVVADLAVSLARRDEKAKFADEDLMPSD